MASLYPQMPPGIGAALTATPKAVFLQSSEKFLAQGRYIDSANARDPSNTVNVGILQPGFMIGKITASGLYGGSIIGLTGGALTSAGTSLTLPSAAVGTEIVRRFGSTGTFNLIGPPAASGVVRTLPVTYSAVSGTTVTITALGVNAVQTLNFANSPAGNFQLGFYNTSGALQWTSPITYSGTAATLVSNINTALNTAFGSSLIVASGTLVTAIAITFSGAGYTNLPQPLGVVDTGALTAGTISITNTTTGVNGAFVTSSIIAPNDGSQIPLSFISDWEAGVAVVGDLGNSVTNPVDVGLFPVWGVIATDQMVNWPADPSLIAWVENQLSTSLGGKFTFAGSSGVY